MKKLIEDITYRLAWGCTGLALAVLGFIWPDGMIQVLEEFNRNSMHELRKDKDKEEWE